MSGPRPAAPVEETRRGLRMLAEAPYAYMAVVDNNRPYVIPVNFACDLPAGRLYLHSGPGRKSAALTENPRVCLALALGATFKRGSTPCSDGFAFRSAVVEGTATLLNDPGEREAALRAIVRKYDSGAAEQPFDPGLFAQTLVYAVDVETVGYKESPRSPGDC